MSVHINENCISCGACLWECPTEAILPGDLRPVVETDICTECYGFFGESQCVVVCPANAIAVTSESLESLSQKFDHLYPDRLAQNTWIWQRIGQCQE